MDFRMSADLLAPAGRAVSRSHAPPSALAAPKRWLAIVNAAAGSMRSERFRTRWLPHIRNATAHVMFSERAGHAAELAAAAKDYDGIAAVGGDGTIHEILSALDRKRQCLAIFPGGRGNSLARDIGADTMAQALTALQSGSTHSIDLLSVTMARETGMTTARLCASNIAIGYVASVVREAKRFASMGRHSYTLAAALTQPRRAALSISYNGSGPVMRHLTGLLVSNTAHAAHYRAFPEANIQDGVFEVMELCAGWIRQNCHNTCVLAGSSAIKPAYLGQGVTICVRPAFPADVLVDGEIVCGVAELTVRAGLERVWVRRLGLP
jgi:diacylglycerol kinase family enzyme